LWMSPVVTLRLWGTGGHHPIGVVAAARPPEAAILTWLPPPGGAGGHPHPEWGMPGVGPAEILER